MEKFTGKIYLNDISIVQKFVSATKNIEGNIYLISGKYTVNGKSLLGIFSLDLSEPVTVELESPIQKDIDNLKEFLI